MSLRTSGGVARTAALLLCLLVPPAFLAGRAAAQEATPRTAVVLDASTRRPVAAAAVAAGRAYAITAPDGSFHLTLPRGTEAVTVTRMGYATVEVAIADWPSEILLEPAPYLLERVAVEVRRGEALASGTALAVASLDRSALDASAGTSLAEALGALVGVEDSRVGSWGSRPVLRGMSGERLAILVDGNRVNRACTFGMDQGLASIEPGQVDHVEVVSGPGSTLFGSGNLGGVINVVTRRGDGARGTGGEVRAGASSAVPGGTAGVSVWTGSPRMSLVGSFDAASYGDYATPEGTVDGSSYRHRSGDLKVDLRPDPAHRLSVKGQRYEGRDIGWPMMRGAQIPREIRTSFSADYGWQRRGVVDAVSAHVFRQKLDHHMTVDAVMPGANGMVMTMKADAVSFSTTSGGRVQLRLAPTSAIRADVGTEVNRWFAEGTRWSESGSGAMPSTSATFRVWPAVTITDAGVFLQGEADVGAGVEASLGLRADHIRRDADEVEARTESVATGNVGLRARLGAGFGVRTSVGIGYRTPDPMELYGLALKPDGFVYRGREDLKTEHNVATEVALTWSGVRADLGLTVFHNAIRDMVSLLLVPDETVVGRPVREYTTLGSATLEGVSGSASVRLPGGFGTRLAVTYTRGTHEKTDLPLPAVPPLTGDVAVRRDFTGVLRWAEIQLEGADAQERVATAAGEVRTPGYGVLNLRAQLRTAGVRVDLGIENVLDRTYRSHLDPVRLLRPGRNLFVRMTRAF